MYYDSDREEELQEHLSLECRTRNIRGRQDAAVRDLREDSICLDYAVTNDHRQEDSHIP